MMKLLKCLKSTVWEHPLASNVLKDSKHWWNLHESAKLFWDELCWKMSLLLRSEILGLFIETLIVDNKYSRHYKENFAQAIEMQLCKKLFFLSQFFDWLSGDLHEVLNVFFKIDEPHSLSIFDILDSKDAVT